PRRQLLRVAREDPASDETAEARRDHHAGKRHDRCRATIATECLGIEMQSSDETKHQNGYRSDPGEWRQGGRIEKQVIVFGSQPPKQRRSEGDADDDLNDDERHYPFKPGKPQYGNRQRDHNERLHQKYYSRGHVLSKPTKALECAATREDVLDRLDNDFQIQRDTARADVLQVPSQGLTPIQKAPTIDLSQPGDTGFTGEFIHFLWGVVLQHLRGFRAR